MVRILLVDDDEDFTSATQAILRREAHDVTTANDLDRARKALTRERFDLLLVDLSLPDGSGLELLSSDSPKAVVITGHPSVETAIRAVKGPVVDYLVKPIDRGQLDRAIRQATRELTPGSGRPPEPKGRIVGESDAVLKMRRQIEEFGPTDATVLVTGESGTGKELVAEALHDARGTRGELVTINCGAIPQELIASELFGHRKGAFTGAASNRAGAFERAGDGTLFLDEVGELPLEQQVALLRVLESRRVVPVGGSKEVSVSARVIAATNRDLQQSVSKGDFREDLYYRLMVLPIEVPPLRHRKGDVALLTRFFLDQFAAEYGTPREIAEPALDLLEKHRWPGNVRELKHTLLRAALQNREKEVLDTLPDNFDRPLHLASSDSGLVPGMSIRDVERTLILKTLEHFDGRRKETAEALGVSLKTLYNRLREYGHGESD
jgi:DNA-binding NtrC family response regulator